MRLYPVSSPAASTIAEGAGGTTIVAIVAGGLVSPTGRPLGLHEVSALAVGGTAKIRTGDTVLMLKVVGVVKASVRRDGRIQAQGSPADYARLGVVEERLDRAAGPGSIAEAARRFPLSGPVMGQRTRVLTAELVLRAVIVMMLLPQASYTEVMTVLAGDLVLVPWAQDWRVPSPRVLSAWRTSTGPGPLEYLRDKVLTAALTEHGEHDWRAVRVGDLHLRSADGTLTRVPDTPANRAAFGSSGTADDSAPYPQVRGLALNDVSTRSLFAMPYGASGGSKPDAEQKLLDKAMDEYPYLFTVDALWLFDRNFPGAPRVARLIKKTHVLSACRTPDRSASSRWESPQATRASRYCSVSPVPWKSDWNSPEPGCGLAGADELADCASSLPTDETTGG